MNRILKSKKMSALTMACLALAISGPAAAQMSGPHNMSDMPNMPGMKMPEKPQTSNSKDNKAEQKTEPAKGEAAAEKPMDGMPGMNRGQTQNPAMPGNAQPGAMQNMDHGAMPGMQPGAMQGMQGNAQGKDAMPGMKMGPMQGGRPPPDARDPNAYAEGTTKHSLGGMEMADDALFGRVLVNDLEYADGRRDHRQTMDAEAWFGGDRNKLWLKAEGERRSGRLDGLRTEALWDRVFATYWSTQLGIRHDTGQGSARNWLAFGVQGLAPYWFETEATAYVGTGGMLAARMEARYELLFTQRLILQPKLEANLYSKNDAARGIGSGLSDLEFGLRLRYEIRRQFAPYIGVSWKRKFGNTAEFARTAGGRANDTEAVAGVRIWF
jgi:copper resistance protein B